MGHWSNIFSCKLLFLTLSLFCWLMPRIKSVSMWKSHRQSLKKPFSPNLQIIRPYPVSWENRNQWVLCDLSCLQHKTSQRKSQLLWLIWDWFGDYWCSVLSQPAGLEQGWGLLCVDSPEWTLRAPPSQPVSSWTLSCPIPGCGNAFSSPERGAGTQFMLSLKHVLHSWT